MHARRSVWLAAWTDKELVMVDEEHAGAGTQGASSRPWMAGLELPGVLTAIASACALVGVVAVIGATYAALDDQAFAPTQVIAQKVAAWLAPAPVPVASAPLPHPAATVVARQPGTAGTHP